MNANETAGIEAKVRMAVSKLGYTLLDKKNGFDLCAKQNGVLKDKYVAIDFIRDDTVSANDVINFLNKLGNYRKVLSEKYVAGWSLEGIIYYTKGELPQNIAALEESLKDTKMKITFKKLLN